MDFALTREQQDWQSLLRRFLGTRCPDPARPSIRWTELADLGCFDDLPFLERVLVAQECGYALCPAPWLTRLALPDEIARVVGAVPIALVGLDGGLVTERDGDGWRVSGESVSVLDAVGATALVCVTPAGLLLAAAADCSILPVDAMDTLRPHATVSCTQVAATALDVADRASAALPGIAQRIDALLTAEAVGVAERTYAIARDHARTRTQFGRPIGSYQGVAFAVAECYLRTELARSLALRAGWLLGVAAPEAEAALWTAAAAARRAATANAEQAIQLLGGVGMTWEHPVHHWYRRALWIDAHGTSTRDILGRLGGRILSGGGHVFDDCRPFGADVGSTHVEQ